MREAPQDSLAASATYGPSIALRHQRLAPAPAGRTAAPAASACSVLGIHGVGSCCSVMRSDSPCHCMPRPNAPSAPPMIRSAARNSAGPMVLANAGTSVVRLLKLVSAFCSIVSGCSRAPSRCVCCLPLGLAGELGGEVRLPEGDVADPADAEHRHQLRPLLLQVGDLLGVGRQLVLHGEVPLLRRDGRVRRAGRRTPAPSRTERRRGCPAAACCPAASDHSSMLKPWTCSQATPHSLRK